MEIARAAISAVSYIIDDVLTSGSKRRFKLAAVDAIRYVLKSSLVVRADFKSTLSVTQSKTCTDGGDRLDSEGHKRLSGHAYLCLQLG